MTAISDFFKKQPLVMALLVFVAGFLLGWFGMGWGLWPVQYENGDISQLRGDLQQQYVVLVADSYAANLDAAKATDAIKQLGPNASKIVSDTVSASKGDEAIRVSQLQVVLQSTLKGSAGQPSSGSEPSLLDKLRLPLIACGVVVVVGLVGGLLFWRLSSNSSTAATRGARPAYVPPAPRPVEDRPQETAPVGVEAKTPPVARFMTTYTLGDDAYDDSFSVDGPDGNFLGECGMGISETIGVGDPKKVTAFEVWLFDKNDIRTVTRVVMSEHAFRDEALKSKLAAKGEPVLAKSGDTVSLETATLVVTARIVDMAYGGGALPPNSYFERLTIELAAYRKPEAASDATMPVAAA
jgi:hypothetical protein